MKSVIAAAAAAALLVISPSLARAQGNPMMDSVKGQHNIIKGNLLKTAEKVPEAVWSFRPTPEVRTFGEIIGHIADSSMGICSSAAGTKPTPLGAAKMTTKAQLSKALADAMAACDNAIAALDDKRAMEVTKFFTGPTTRGMVIAFNTAHNFEHYGNLVTYMRINKIVPPSSEGQD
jgi:uncharacterized damage-inducible protein DinB